MKDDGEFGESQLGDIPAASDAPDGENPGPPGVIPLSKIIPIIN